jgi:hypothetical protein
MSQEFFSVLTQLTIASCSTDCTTPLPPTASATRGSLINYIHSLTMHPSPRPPRAAPRRASSTSRPGPRCSANRRPKYCYCLHVAVGVKQV